MFKSLLKTAFITIIGICLSNCKTTAPPPIKTVDSPISDFVRFGVEGGYGPGSIVKIDKKIASPILTREYLLRVIADKSVLDLTAPISLPQTSYQSEKEFKSELDAKLDKYKALGIDVKGSLDNIQTATLKVGNGSRYFFKVGSISFSEVLQQLPLTKLETIKKEFADNKNLHMITEVTEYASASLFLTWGKNLDVNLKAKIREIIDFGSSNKWRSDDTLEVKYSQNIIVSYKSKRITKEDLKDIDSLILKRRADGDPKPKPMSEFIGTWAGYTLRNVPSEKKELQLVISQNLDGTLKANVFWEEYAVKPPYPRRADWQPIQLIEERTWEKTKISPDMKEIFIQHPDLARLNLDLKVNGDLITGELREAHGTLDGRIIFEIFGTVSLTRQ